MPTANDLNTRERSILAGALRDIRRFAAANVFSLEGDRYDQATTRERFQDARDRTCHIEAAAWLGRALSPSDRTLNSRSYKRLESLGLIIRLCDWNRYVTHLRLTDEGERIAAELMSTMDGEAIANSEPAPSVAPITDQLAPATDANSANVAEPTDTDTTTTEGASDAHDAG